MKTGTDNANDSASVVQTTVTKRILPVPSEKAASPEFWDYLAELNLQDWARHILYMYRTEPSGPAGQSVPMGKFVDTSLIPWNDREEAELAIMQKFGGRMFRVIVKRGSERVCEGKIYIDAQPRTLAPQPQEVVQPNPMGFPASEGTATERVASQAITTIAGYERQGAQIGMEALTTAANVLARFAAPPAAGATDDLTKQLFQAMITKMLNPPTPPPPPDPIELLTKLMTLQNQLAGGPGINPLKNFSETVEMLKTFGVKVGGESGPAVSAGAELVRSLPSIGQQIVQGLTEYRLMMEAQRDAIAMQRGAAPAPAADAPRPSLPPGTPPAPQAPPAPSAAPANGGAKPMPDIMQLIELKIVEILAEPQSAEWAAEETLMFLDRLDKSIVPQLASQGEQGLMTLFTTRELLKPATANVPRLTEFIRAFLKHAGDNAGEVQSVTDTVPRPN